LKTEISSEISAVRYEQKLQRVSEDTNPESPHSVQINISGHQTGSLKGAGAIDSIQQNLSMADDANDKQTAEAAKNFTEAVIDSSEFS
jgi:hypothetical protein